ncbi:hypothetical protein BC940DRAFT_57087 [Gongronella butleri]|nr:hypothetical protein BC940DRAFT_57087 [Gongronella butleri]
MSLPVCTMGVLVPPSPPSAELLMQPQDDARLRQEATAMHHASEMGFADASAMVTPPPSNNHSNVNNIQPPPTTSSTSTPPLRMATHPLTWLPFQTAREKETNTSMAPPPVMAPPACATTMAISPSASSTLSSSSSLSSLSSNASLSSSLTPGAVIHAASLSASSTNTQIQPKNGYMTPFNESAYTTAPLLSTATVMSPLWGHVATDLAANTTNTPPSASSAFPFMSEAPPPTFPIIMDAWSPSASVFSLDHRLSW